MTATKRYINHLRHKCRMDIDKALELYILSIYEEEPFPNVWSEQDLYEQLRDLEMEYNAGKLCIPPVPSKYKRLKKRYERLKSDFRQLSDLYLERCGEWPEGFGWPARYDGENIYIEEMENECF